MKEVPVLIIGGGPAGLCASILLSRHGVPSLLVERHESVSMFPRARFVDQRAMLFRVWGIEAAIRARELRVSPCTGRRRCAARCCAGRRMSRTPTP